MGKKDIIINDVTRDTIVYGEYVYKSNKHGMFRINKKVFVKTEIYNKYKYEVEFENTGFTRICDLHSQIRTGYIKDELAADIVGKTFNSRNYGQFIVLGKTNHKDNSNNYYYKVRFFNTGYERLTTKNYIIAGKLKDPFYPTVYGVGYYGILPTGLDRGDRLYEALYIRWTHMISRCYNPLDAHYQYYGARGIYVDKRWHCFSTYFHDVQLLYGFDKEKITAECTHLYQLDKDILCEYKNINPKRYSSDTCIWVDRSTNLDYRSYGDSIPNQHKHSTLTDYIKNINTEEVKPLIQIKPDDPDSTPLIRFLK